MHVVQNKEEALHIIVKLQVVVNGPPTREYVNRKSM
jgi:hypothetical protein